MKFLPLENVSAAGVLSALAAFIKYGWLLIAAPFIWAVKKFRALEKTIANTDSDLQAYKTYVAQHHPTYERMESAVGRIERAAERIEHKVDKKADKQ